MNKCVIALLAMCTLYLSADARTYKIGMVHWIAYSPLNVADVLGLWKSKGLDVQVINYASNEELNGALRGRRIDIALDMLGSWVGMYLDGVDLTILGETDWSNGGDKIIVKKGYDISKIKGTKVGVYLDLPSVTYFLDKYLEANNLSLADVKIAKADPSTMTDHFIKNNYQLIVNYDPQALRAVDNGNGSVVATSATYPGVIPEGFVCMTENLKTIPKLDLISFCKGWIEAVAWTKSPANWEAYKKILNEKTFVGEEPYSDNDLKEMMNAVSVHSGATLIKNNEVGIVSYLVDLKKFLKKNGILKKEYSEKTILDNTLFLEAMKK